MGLAPFESDIKDRLRHCKSMLRLHRVTVIRRCTHTFLPELKSQRLNKSRQLGVYEVSQAMGVEKFSRHLVDLEDGGDEAGFVCGLLFGQADHLELGVFLGGFEIGEGF